MQLKQYKRKKQNMIIRTTNKCIMNCNHCMIDANENGLHMDLNTFKKALKFNIIYDRFILIISGGEPTLHPEFIDILKLLYNYKTIGKVLILSNGLFLYDKKYTDEILSYEIDIQITNDKKYYPKKIPEIKHRLLTYEYNIKKVSPFGRALKNKLYHNNFKGPHCFNLRSCAYNSNNFKDAILKLRSNFNFCTPTINIDGSISIGESTQCYTIGSIDHNEKDLFENILNATCDKCKMSKGLNEPMFAYWKLLQSGLI